MVTIISFPTTVPPPILIFTQSPGDEHHYISTQLNMTCTVLISAAVDTLWTGSNSWSGPQGRLRYGVHVSRSHGSSSSLVSMIQIDSLRSSDSGTYGCSAMILDGTNSRCGLMAGVKVFCVVLYHCPRSCHGLAAAGKQGTPSCYQETNTAFR